MKSALAKLSLTALALTGGALTSCVMPPGSYGGPGYNGGYRHSGGGYEQDGGYAGQPDDGGPEFVESGEVDALPVGAYVVIESGERHWYYNGQCYRRGSHGYVILHKRVVVHHDDYRNVRDVHHIEEHKIVQQPHHEEHRVEERKIVQPPHHEERHEEHHENLIYKNGHTYKKGPDGKLIMVK